MKIWFVKISEVLPTQTNERQLRTSLFASYLAYRGHDVIWFSDTFSHFQKKHLFDTFQDFRINGVRLILFKLCGYKRNVSLTRIIHHKLFAKSFYKYANKMIEKPDLVICSFPTTENLYYVNKYCTKNGVPFVLDFRDFWIDNLIGLFPGYLKYLAKLMLYGSFIKVKLAAGNAKGLIACSPKLLSLALSYANRDITKRDFVMYHGYPNNLFNANDNLDSIRYWNDIGIHKDDFVVCFFGTMGTFFDFEFVIKSIQKYSSLEKIKFVFCGHGSSLNYYKSLSNNLDNVFFPGFVDKQKIQSLMELSKVGLAPYNKSWKNEFGNKIFEYMSGSLVILSSIKIELPNLIDDETFYFTYSLESHEDFVNKLLYLYDNVDKTNFLRQISYREFSTKYNHNNIFANTEKYLESLIT